MSVAEIAPLIPTAEAAEMLGLQPQTLRKWRVKGVGPPYVRFGGPSGRVAYRRSEIEAWLRARTFESTAAETVARVG
jgi:predicted DNA-binding transcriptional regulator AlpA